MFMFYSTLVCCLTSERVFAEEWKGGRYLYYVYLQPRPGLKTEAGVSLYIIIKSDNSALVYLLWLILHPSVLNAIDGSPQVHIQELAPMG